MNQNAVETIPAPAPAPATVVETYRAAVETLCHLVTVAAPAGLLRAEQRIHQFRASKYASTLYLDFAVDEEDFARGRDMIHLQVTFESFACRRSSREPLFDAEGNEYCATLPEVKLGWSATGAQTLPEAKAFSTRLSEVTSFAETIAETISAEFSEPIFQMVATAAERAEQESRKAADRMNAILVAAEIALRPLVKGMRKGAEDRFAQVPASTVPVGSYEVAVNGRLIALQVSETIGDPGSSTWRFAPLATAAIISADLAAKGLR